MKILDENSYRNVTSGAARALRTEDRPAARASMAETIIHNVGALCDEVTRLRAIIAHIDKTAPRADRTCDEPGITLSEAARRALEAKP